MPPRLATTDMDRRIETVRGALRRSIELKQQVLETSPAVVIAMADAVVAAVKAGGKLMLCGNGGSAADAQHLAAELLVRLRPHVNRDGIPALALALDSSSLTACGNDYSYESFYARMTATLGRPGDVLLGITTSGRSPNVVAALQTARQRDVTTLGFLGGDGGPAAAHCDLALVVPSRETARIQEVHITLGHALMELVEDGLLASGTVRTASGAA